MKQLTFPEYDFHMTHQSHYWFDMKIIRTVEDGSLGKTYQLQFVSFFFKLGQGGLSMTVICSVHLS